MKYDYIYRVVIYTLKKKTGKEYTKTVTAVAFLVVVLIFFPHRLLSGILGRKKSSHHRVLA